MATLTFADVIADDMKNTFLSGDFSQVAIYKSGSNIKEVTIQFFEESLDKLATKYHHVWCSFTDIPYVKHNDSLTIDGDVYAIVDSSPDEFKTGMNLFIQKV